MRGDYLDAELILPINSFLCRCFEYGFCNAVAMVEQLLEKFDRKMFLTIQNSEHCIQTLLSPSTDSDRSLRPSGHNYQPSVVTRKLCHQSFIPHSFFSNMYMTVLVLGVACVFCVLKFLPLCFYCSVHVQIFILHCCVVTMRARLLCAFTINE